MSGMYQVCIRYVSGMSQQLTTQEVKKAHIRIDSIVFAFFRLRFNMPYTMEDTGHVP